MTGPLDDLKAIRKLDPGDTLGALQHLPQQVADAWATAKDLQLPGSYKDIDSVVVLGMGGSAIGGDIWRTLIERSCPVPVFNVRQYDLPPYVNDRTLVIASSFSGDTEEVLSAFDQALAKSCPKIAITTGGQLLATARERGVPVFSFDYQQEPRAALGWGLMPLLAIAQSLGLLQKVDRDVAETIAVLTSLVGLTAESVPTERNAAKQMATTLQDKLPVIYGAGPLIEVAKRWKTQLNESGKTWAFFEELPEIHHNAVIGYGRPAGVVKDTAVVFLHSDDLIHPRVLLRYDYTKRLLAKAEVTALTAHSSGRSALAQIMSLTLFGDYVSAYLAFLYGVDPTPTVLIDQLKAWLKQQK